MPVVRPLKALLLATLLSITGLRSIAQDNADSRIMSPIDVVGGSLNGKEMIFIAETHSIEEKRGFYNTFVPWMANQYGIHHLVLETGHSLAYLLNRYLAQGDTTIMMYFRDSMRQEILAGFKAMYNATPAGKKLVIHGMDFERMEFVVAARRILALNNVRGTTLNALLDTVPDSMLHKLAMTPAQSRMRKELYGNARKVFAQEKAVLKAAVRTDFDVLERIFENPATEGKFSRRDKGMYHNLTAQMNGVPYICIVGLYHVTYTRHQVYPSLIKLMTRHSPDTRAKLAIIDEVSNRKYLTTRLWSKEGAPQQYTTGKEGPDRFVNNDSAMQRAYTRYLSTTYRYRLVHKSIFSDVVHKDNHGLNSYYVFFGNSYDQRE